MKVKILIKKLNSLLINLRAHSIIRKVLNKKIKKISKKIKKGLVLEIGCGRSPYKSIIPHKKYFTLDKNKEYRSDLISDAHYLCFKNKSFDTIIITEVLEHCCEPQKVADEIYRVLKKSGVCLLSTRFIHPLHGKPNDYFRFTEYGLKHLFKKFKKIKVYRLGNKLHCIWDLISYRYFWVILNLFNSLISLIDYEDEFSPLGYLVLCKK